MYSSQLAAARVVRPLFIYFLVSGFHLNWRTLSSNLLIDLSIRCTNHYAENDESVA